jgi:hypothetical protein
MNSCSILFNHSSTAWTYEQFAPVGRIAARDGCTLIPAGVARIPEGTTVIRLGAKLTPTAFMEAKTGAMLISEGETFAPMAATCTPVAEDWKMHGA